MSAKLSGAQNVLSASSRSRKKWAWARVRAQILWSIKWLNLRITFSDVETFLLSKLRKFWTRWPITFLKMNLCSRISFTCTRCSNNWELLPKVKVVRNWKCQLIQLLYHLLSLSLENKVLFCFQYDIIVSTFTLSVYI